MNTSIARDRWLDIRRIGIALLTMALAMSVLFVPPAAASSDEVSRFIVQEVDGAGDAPELLVEEYGGEVIEQLSLIGGFVADLPVGSAALLIQHPEVASMTPDSSVQFLDAASLTSSTAPTVGIWESASKYTDPFYAAGSMNRVSQTINADDAWGYGFTGAGIGVALIDSGVTPVAGLSDPGKLINGPDVSFESQSEKLRYVDTFGHGTHMAGIIAGRDQVSSDYDEVSEKMFVGIAPDASLVSVKTANADGATDVSQVIAAIDWVVQHRNDNGMNIRVLNLSFGTDGIQSYLLDPLSFAIEQAWKAGIVVVVAAGNDGNGALLRNPALDPFVIAVGAANGNSVADFSNCGDKNRSVDLVAPGKSIISLRNPGSSADILHPEARVDDRFFLGSGTSQAAAVVSGAVALLLDYRPDLSPDQVKALMMQAANPVRYASDLCQGAGMVDVLYAMKWAGTDLGGMTQSYAGSNGTGSLEAARGSFHISLDGNDLSGEQDIFGSAWDGEAHAKLSANGLSWSGGDWNGVTWSGVSWSGLSWSGVSWSGLSWSGVSWSGLSWSGVSWSGLSWSNSAWSGVSWD